MANRTDYTVTITTTSRELSKREKIMIKDTGDAAGLDQASADGVQITPDLYAILAIHNEKGRDNTDYEQIVIIDKEGNKYVTGSSTFIESFLDIAEEMGDEEFTIKVVRKESRNYSGKYFLKAALV